MLNTATFSPLKNRTFALLVTGSLLANLGNTIQSVGAAWHLTQLGQPADVVALAQTAYNLPIMLLALPAGAWSDMVDKKLLLQISLLLMLAVSIVLVVMVEMGLAGPVAIIGLTALLACGVACIIPAAASAVNFAVPRGQLAAAVALNILGFNVARSFGPALGGMVTSIGGAGAAFAVNGAAYALVILLLWRWRLDAPKPEKRKIGPVMAEGLRYAFASKPIRTIMLRAITFTSTGAAAWAIMPLFSSQVLGEGSFIYGLLLAALGVGAVIGAASATWFRSRFSAEVITRVSGMIYGTGCVLVALQPALWTIMLLLVMAGAGWVQALSGFAVSGQMWSPQKLVGRIAALVSSVTFGGIAIGSWLWGHFADAHGITTAFITSGIAMILLPLLGLIFRMPDHADAQPDDRSSAQSAAKI